MTTDNAPKVGDEVKVIDAQHYAAGNLGIVKSIVKDVHTVEVKLANDTVAMLKFMQKQLGAIEDEVQQGLDVLTPGTNGSEDVGKPDITTNVTT